MERSDDPLYYVNREREWQRNMADRRARYRGFRDVDHFLQLAAERGSTEAVMREYRIIIAANLSIDTLPFPVIPDDT